MPPFLNGYVFLRITSSKIKAGQSPAFDSLCIKLQTAFCVTYLSITFFCNYANIFSLIFFSNLLFWFLLQLPGKEHPLQRYPKRETLFSPISIARVSQEHFLRQSLEMSVIPHFSWQNASECLEQMNQLILDDQFHSLLFTTTGMFLAWKVLTENSTIASSYLQSSCF